MRAAVYHGRGDVRIQQVPDPGPPGVGEILVAIKYVSICGTDLSEYRAGPLQVPLQRPHPVSGHVGPVIIGHEFVGTVAALGEGVTGFDAGERVTSGAASRCGVCRWCAAGRANLCPRRFLYGVHAHGAAAEWVRLPAEACVRVPEGCGDANAALAQPLACARHAARRSGVHPGDRVMVIGVGGLGAGVLAALGDRDAALIVAADVHPRRLVLAAELGATHTVVAADADPAALAGLARSVTQGAGMDVVIEASGTPAGLAAAWACVRRGGRVHLVGLPARPVPVDLAGLVTGEVDITGSNGCLDADLPAALELLASGDLGARLTDRIIPLADLVEDGLHAAAEGGVHGKVVAAVT